MRKIKMKTVIRKVKVLPSKWQALQRKHRLPIIVFAVMFAALGCFYLFASHAAGLPGGPIWGVNNLCLTNVNGVAKNSNPVAVKTCNGSVAQRWLWNGDGTVRVQGYCLGVSSINTAFIYGCNSSWQSQQWQPTLKGALVNPKTGLCLGTTKNGTASGTLVGVFACNGSAAQMWNLQAAASAGTITSAVSGKCVDLPWGNTANGSKPYIQTCNGNVAEKWLFIGDAGNMTSGVIKGYLGNKCLEVAGAAKTLRAAIDYSQCTGSPGQIWNIQANGSLLNPNSNMCLAPLNGTDNQQNLLEIYTCNGTASEHWTLSILQMPHVKSVPAPTPTSAPVPPSPAKSTSTTNGFVHPGILLSKQQLDYVKKQLAAGAQPWTSALARARTAKASQGKNAGVPFLSLNWTPRPISQIGCGGSNRPDEGCFDATNDATAAYGDALVWYYTGDSRYAQKAIQIMNAWSSTLSYVKFDTTTYTNGELVAAWFGQTFPRAAEIIRYTTPPALNATFNVTKFSSMLNNIILPRVDVAWKGGGANWLMSFADATMNIGVFTDNRSVFNTGIAMWRAEVPSVIYMAGDKNQVLNIANTPLAPPGTGYDSKSLTTAKLNKYWYSPRTYVSGLEGETCRDINHLAMGLAAMTDGAETARLQGIDLYGEQKTRIVTGLERNAFWIDQSAKWGNHRPSGWVCPNPAGSGTLSYNLTFEIAYNEYANRLHMSLPNTKQLITDLVRTNSSYVANYFMDFETLTSAGTP